MNQPIRILLVDDSPYFLDAARDFLHCQESLSVVGVATEGDEALDQSQTLEPDIILLDLNLSGSSGLELIPIFKEKLPRTRIIVLTMMEEGSYGSAAMQAGADGFVHKSTMSKTLISAILEVMERAGTPAVIRDNDTTGQAGYGKVQFMRLAEHVPDLIYRYELTPRRGFTYVSSSATAMTGYTPKEHYADPDLGFKLVHPDDRHLLEELIQSKSKEAIQEPLVLRWMHKDGTMLWTEQYNTAIFDSEGNLTAIEGIARDITRHKQVEEALRESEAALQKAQRVAHVGSWAWHVQENRLEWSDEMYHLFGIERETFTGNLADVIARAIHPDDRAAVEQANLDVIQAQKAIPLEYRVIWPDGTVRTVWAEAGELILNDEGQAVMLTGIVQDITAREEAEEALRQSEDRYHDLVDHIHDLIGTHDLEGNILSINPAATRLLGIDEKTILRMNLRDLLTPEVRDQFEGYLDVLQQEGRASGLMHVQLLSGERRIWEYDNTLRKDPIDRPVVRAMARDITERRRAEDALRESEEKFKYVFDHSPLGKSITQTDGRMHVNDAFSKMLGYSQEELRDLSWQEITHPDDIALSQSHIDPLLSGEKDSAHFSKRYLHKDGSTVWAEVSTALRRDALGRPLYFMTTVSDITDRKRAEDALAEKDRLLLDAERVASLGSWEIDLASGEIHYSPEMYHLFGISPEMFSHDVDGFLALIHADDRENMLRWISDVLAGKDPGELDFRVALMDGAIRHVHGRGELHFDATGKPYRVSGTAQDITERKLAESELRESQAQLLGVIHSTMDAIITIDEDHRITLFNPAAEQMFACPASEAVGSFLDRFIPDAARDKHRSFVRAYGRTGETRRMMRTRTLDLNCLRADGTLFPGEISISQFEVNGQKRFIASIRDITKRRLAQEKLADSESELRALFAAMHDVVVVYDEDGRYTRIAPTRQSLLMKPPEELLGKTLHEVLPVAQADEFLAQIRGVIRSRQTADFEYSLAIDGSPVWFLASISPLNGKSVLWVAHDITSRKLAEAKVQRHVERLNALRQIDQAITSTFDIRVNLNVVLFRTTKLLAVDAALVMLLDQATNTLRYEAGTGFRSNAVQTVSIKLGESYAGKVAQERRLLQIPNLADEPDNLFRASFLEAEGFVSYHGAPLIVKGKVVGVLEVFNRSVVERDQEWLDFFSTLASQAAIAVDNAQLFSLLQRELAERRLAEEELRKLNAELEQRVAERTIELQQANTDLERALRVKDEFLANMSHELRTPLNAILGLSESLGEQTAGELNEKQQRYVNVISESGRHLLELINDILDLAKIEAGQIELNRGKVTIKSLCESSLRMIKQLAQKKDQEITLDVDNNIDLIWADQRRLKQMIVNLLSNAVKFTPQNGKLGLEARGDYENNEITITVWDTGIGIKEDDLGRLFHPFVQLDSDLARETPGTGLGLALVAQMARLHGGSVHAVSQVGVGSRFSIRLPWETALLSDTISRLKISGSVRMARPGEGQSIPEILLIEDTEEVTMMLRDYLEYYGYKVATAKNGLEGLAQAMQVHPDLILMDVQMPGMNGLEVTQKLRCEMDFKKTPIIALTALAMPNDRERCIAAGMSEYMSKPVHLKALLKMIQTFLP